MLSGGWAWQKLVSLPFARLSPLRSGRTCEYIYICIYIQPRSLHVFTHVASSCISLCFFPSFCLSSFFFSHPSARWRAWMQKGGREGGKKGEKGRARWWKVSRRAATISSLHGNAPPFTPPPLFFRTRLITLDKRTRSVITFFLYRPPFLNDPRWKFKLTFLFIFSFFVFTY